MLLDSLQSVLQNLPSTNRKLEDNYETLRRERLSLPQGRERIRVGEELGRQYIVHDLDSAITYYSLALGDAMASGDAEDQLRVKLKIFSIFPVFGVVREAVEGFESIDYTTINPKLRKAYWTSAAEMYNLIQQRYPDGTFKDGYKRKMLAAIDSLATFYDNDAALARYLSAQSMLLRGETNLAVASFLEVLPELQSHPELTDNALGVVISHYRNKPAHRQLYMSYLLWRALKDLERGLVRPPSLAELGKVLYEEGYESLGRQCVATALESSDRSYASIYTTDFDPTDYTYILTSQASNFRRYGYVFIIVGALVVFALVFLLVKTHRKTEVLGRQLDEAQARSTFIIKESHLTNKNLINLMFLTLEQMGEFNVFVMRKLKAGQAKDLYDYLESGTFIQKHYEKYFQEFDSTFLSSFPDFVKGLNALLLPDKQLSLLPGERMSPELRIAAFIRLGITDSPRLARILGLSLNTIYAYRNRLRGRALNRETFEADIQKIV